MSTRIAKTAPNAIDTAIASIGDTHVLCIIHHLGEKPMRFNELQRAINGLNPSTLTQRLKKLERDRILVRKKETLDRLSVVYELTEKGKGLLPVIRAIETYSRKFLGNTP